MGVEANAGAALHEQFGHAVMLLVARRAIGRDVYQERREVAATCVDVCTAIGQILHHVETASVSGLPQHGAAVRSHAPQPGRSLVQNRLHDRECRRDRPQQRRSSRNRLLCRSARAPSVSRHDRRSLNGLPRHPWPGVRAYPPFPAATAPSISNSASRCKTASSGKPVASTMASTAVVVACTAASTASSSRTGSGGSLALRPNRDPTPQILVARSPPTQRLRGSAGGTPPKEGSRSTMALPLRRALVPTPSGPLSTSRCEPTLQRSRRLGTGR